jgi:hypothetical protein
MNTARSGITKACPECGYVFRGGTWGGIDAHWKAEHKQIMPYKEAWLIIKAGRKPSAGWACGSPTGRLSRAIPLRRNLSQIALATEPKCLACAHKRLQTPGGTKQWKNAIAGRCSSHSQVLGRIKQIIGARQQELDAGVAVDNCAQIEQLKQNRTGL